MKTVRLVDCIVLVAWCVVCGLALGLFIVLQTVMEELCVLGNGTYGTIVYMGYANIASTIGHGICNKFNI